MDVTLPKSPPKLTWFKYLAMNVNWLALTLRSQVLSGLVVPLLVQNFVGEAQKGSYFGTIRLWALMVALLSQALAGILSDHNHSRWGRRRPFILVATFAEAVLIVSLAWVANLQGMSGYSVLFIAYLLSMYISNHSHAATQGFIPDLVPLDKRGLASGVKLLFEVPIPFILVGLVITPILKSGNLLGALLATVGIMIFCMLISMTVKEEPLKVETEPFKWNALLSLFLMTAVFTLIILGIGQGIKLLLTNTALSSRLLIGTIGVLGMIVAVVGGIYAALSVHLDKTIRKNTSFIWLIITRLAALVAANNLAAFLLYFFQEKFSMPTEQAISLAGQLPMVLGAFILIFGLVAGWASDRMNRKLLVFISCLISVVGVVIMIAGNSIPFMYIAGAVIGLAIAFFNVSIWALSTEIIPRERAAEFLGITNLAGAGAGAVGAYIGGTIADHSGYVLMMATFGIMFLLAAVSSLFIKVKPHA